MTDLAAVLRRAIDAGVSARLYATPSGDVVVQAAQRRQRSATGRREVALSFVLPDAFDDVELTRAVRAALLELEERTE